MPKKSSIIGFDALSKKLQTLSNAKEIGDAMKTEVRGAMQEVKKTAAGLIPEGIDPHVTYKGRVVTPGFAKRSLRVVARLDKKRGAAYALLGVRAEAFYAIQFVELGTSKMAAQPWLLPAFEQSTDNAVRMVAQGLREWIIGIATKHQTGVYGGGQERADQLLNLVEGDSND
jgi:HK97 gp10 family phage protein